MTQTNLTLGGMITIIDGVLSSFDNDFGYYWSCSKLYVSHGSITYTPVLYREPKNPFTTLPISITFYKSGAIGSASGDTQYELNQFESIEQTLAGLGCNLSTPYYKHQQPNVDLGIAELIELCNLVEYHELGGECILNIKPRTNWSSLTLKVHGQQDHIIWSADSILIGLDDVYSTRTAFSNVSELYLKLSGQQTAI